jgi:riboflavin biosynthesis pyrimidine reductase
MMPFADFADRKTRAAAGASIHPLSTVADRAAEWDVTAVGSPWTRRCYDGPFHLFGVPDDRPAISIVFVQSQDGNTAAADPTELGGGPTDTHVIYEGLSRVAADGVLAGAATAAGPDVFFSVWHPEIVALREQLRLPRHPAQVVLSQHGHVELDRTLLFNVPQVPVYLIAGEPCREHCAPGLASRPWITIVPIGPDGLRPALTTLRLQHGIRRLSVVGGRRTASSLVDAGLVQDLCLTTTSHQGGEPNTPVYVGSRRPRFAAIVSKRETQSRAPIRFDHLGFTGFSSL